MAIPKKIVLLLLLSVLLCSCHKYPEDGFISPKRPSSRIQKSWKFTSYKINGVEHGHDFDSLLYPNTLYDCYVYFRAESNGAKWGEPILKDKNDNLIYRNSGDRYTLPSFQEIQITVYDTLFNEKLWCGPKVNSPAIYTGATWTIRKLYRKELHLRKGNVDIYFKEK